MDPWLQLCERALPASEFAAAPERAEARVGPLGEPFSVSDLDAFRACTVADAPTFAALVEHPLHRHLVKLLVLATRHVPDWLVPHLLVAACLTVNPSFNGQFIAPCVLVHGRRRVMSGLLELARHGTNRIKVGAANAAYWGAIAREEHMWPGARRRDVSAGPPDADVADLCAGFAAWAVAEFVDNPALDVRRALVRFVASPHVRDTEAGQRAVGVARAHEDAFIRERLRYDLGETKRIPPLPWAVPDTGQERLE